MNNDKNNKKNRHHNDGDDERIIISTGRTWVLIGFALFLIPNLWNKPLNFLESITQFFNQLGFALIAFGIVAIILQFKDWKLYFQRRLKDVVIERSYLNTLNNEQLAALQVETLKVQNEGTDIEREGSFLNYFQRKIRHYISSPYRENVTYWTVIKESKENAECFEVSEKVSYTCRSIGKDIQKEVKWTHEPGEFEKIHDIEFVFSCYKKIIDECDESCKAINECKDGKLKLNKSSIEKHPLNNGPEKGYKIKLKDILCPADHLKIEINANYIVKKNKIFNLHMAHPSKDITLTVSFPKEYELDCFVGGVEPPEYHKSIIENMFTFKHEDWLLPRCGISYNLTKK
mgnify:CR=1 FL=1